MPIEFACPQCRTTYQVKQVLAGKSAKCAKCGQRLRIPSPAAPPSQPKPKPKSVAPAKAPAPTPAEDGVASWLDDELEVEQPVATSRAPAGTTCPGCGAAMDNGAVLCVMCGYDTRCGEKLTTRRVVATDAEKPKRVEKPSLGMAASLLRGTLFSFIGALVGAFIWALLVYLTMSEFAIVAWGLGGLVGLGMALGHEDEDGTWAGIIAAFMSLFGIVAAKIMIIVIFVGAAVASGEIDLAAGGVEFDETELQRAVLTAAIAGEKLEAQGIDADDLTEEQREQVMTEARNEVAGLSDEEVQSRLDQLSEEQEMAEDEPDADEEEAEIVADEEFDEQIEDEPLDELDPGAEPSLISLFFATMFQPIDGLFILLAFFTAYKVGSGTMTD